jgi:hypothetical protein
MIAGNHRGSRFNDFRAQGKPVETGFIPVMTGFTRLKPGANERRSINIRELNFS